MWLKILTFFLLVGFVYFLVKRRLHQRKLAQAGIEVSTQSGLRPITVLAMIMLGMYAGYLLFHFLG